MCPAPRGLLARRGRPIRCRCDRGDSRTRVRSEGVVQVKLRGDSSTAACEYSRHNLPNEIPGNAFVASDSCAARTRPRAPMRQRCSARPGAPGFPAASPAPRVDLVGAPRALCQSVRRGHSWLPGHRWHAKPACVGAHSAPPRYPAPKSRLAPPARRTKQALPNPGDSAGARSARGWSSVRGFSRALDRLGVPARKH